MPLRDVARQLRGVRLWPIALAFLVTFTAIFVHSLKLWILVRTTEPKASLLDVLRAYYIGTFFNAFLPTSVGGDLMKINEMRKAAIPLRHAAASVVVERGTGVIVVLVLAAAFSICWGSLFARLKLGAVRWPLAVASVGFFALLGCLYALWRARLKALLKSRAESKVLGRIYWVIESFYAFADRPAAMLAALGLSALFYAVGAANIVLVAHAVGASVSPILVVGIIPIVKIPEMLSISVGGLGIREGAMTYCLAHLDVAPAQAAAVALMLRLLSWMHSALGGFIYALGRRSAKQGGDHARMQ